ncbi:hypothetical protein I3842_09G027800 [Carya illinoinensis]|uniref:Uncharacterized protein n=1 Tax=Carya illinoinensis TaxID=32201 RepID=A0A922E1C6_CARIL|nr:hypothetical protein I3842_09G027800 [Carya illinoinensis]
MGTRGTAYEEKLRSGNLYHDPTIYPGLGSPRCPRCLSLLNPNPAGAGIGEIVNAVHGLNTGIPQLQNRLKGPKWLPFIVGLPPLLLFSGASVAFGGYALPKFAQLTVISCRCTCYEVDFTFPKFASNGAVVVYGIILNIKLPI